MIHKCFIVLGLSLSVVFFTEVTAKCHRPSVLIVSFDGFRHDFLTAENTPYLYKLRTKGTYADFMRNVFPTDTFPNHHSMATGVYTEVHGVLTRNIFDPVLKNTIKSDSLWNYNKDVVPIWILNEENRDGCHSGSMMWPGANETYRNTTATFVVNHNDTSPWRGRVDTVIQWLTDITTPANLVMVYFEQPDNTLHEYGPASEQVLREIKNVDNISQYIYEQLASHKLENVNVFLLSDHGVVGVDKSHIIKIGEKIEDRYTSIKQSPIFYIWPKNSTDKGEEDYIFNTLKNESVENEHFSVYRKSDIPVKWHFKQNDRVPPILAVANEGYAFQDLLSQNTEDNATWGVHGYDNSETNMWPFFMCWGPQIKVNHKTLPFDNLDLFSLWSKILLLPPSKTNGTLIRVQDILLTPSIKYQLFPITHLGIALIIIFLVSSVVLVICLAKQADKVKHRGYASNFNYDKTPLEYNRLLDKTSV